VDRRGVPIPALLLSTTGLVIATIVAVMYPQSAYVYLFGIALFGGLFVWVMIFVTHIYFRRKWDAGGNRKLPVRMIGYPYTSILGALLVAGIITTTWWVDGMRPTIYSGLPWLAFISIVYLVWRRADGQRAVAVQPSESSAD
jgi:L-asparagine transporter-like permease